MHTSIVSNSVLTIEADGTRLYYLWGKLHRTDGPAIERADGTKWWYLNGQRHREDGPAYEGADGTRWWYLNDREHTLDSYMKKLKMPKQDQVMFKLKWGG